MILILVGILIMFSATAGQAYGILDSVKAMVFRLAEGFAVVLGGIFVFYSFELQKKFVEKK